MNSITPATSLSQTLLNFAPRENKELRQGLETIHATGKALMDFVQSYRQYTHIPQPDPAFIDLQEFTERMVNLAKHQFPCPDIRFSIHISPADLILYADEKLISQVVINILKNAIQALDDQADGEIKITAHIDQAETITLIISNNGPLIPDEVAENIFVPFFTTRSDGSGIGLSISRHIMKLSGGNLALNTDKENQLTHFILTFH
ncbi:MAG: HAMP domain-containing histidine kinase [Bacteroides sp.]|nr:HAMP domain-containing histidine kinase [Bacteroides sp.]